MTRPDDTPMAPRGARPRDDLRERLLRWADQLDGQSMGRFFAAELRRRLDGVARAGQEDEAAESLAARLDEYADGVEVNAETAPVMTRPELVQVWADHRDAFADSQQAEVLAYVERLEAVVEAARRARGHALLRNLEALDDALAALDAGGESRG